MSTQRNNHKTNRSKTNRNNNNWLDIFVNELTNTNLKDFKYPFLYEL